MTELEKEIRFLAYEHGGLVRLAEYLGVTYAAINLWINKKRYVNIENAEKLIVASKGRITMDVLWPHLKKVQDRYASKHKG